MPFAHTALARTGSNEFSYRTNDLQGEVLAVSYFDPAKVIGLKAMDIIVVTAAIGGARPEVLTVLVTTTTPSVIVQAVSDSLRDAALCPLPAELGWSDRYGINRLGYREIGGVRRGFVDGYSPWASPEYSVCRNGPEYNINYTTGSDTTGNGSRGNPWKTKTKAQVAANAGGVDCTIRVAGDPAGMIYPRSGAGTIGGVVPTVNICWLAAGGLVYTGSIDSYTWTADGTYTNLSKTTRSLAISCYNPSRLDASGNYLAYDLAPSLAACNARPGTWYTDGATVWVNTHDGNAATDANARIFVNVQTGVNFNFGANPKHFFIDGETDADGWEIQGGRNKIFATAYGSADTITSFRRVASKYVGYNNSDQWNSFGFDNLRGMIWLEDCYGLRPANDVFNCHNNLGTQKPYFVTLNCRGEDAGVFNPDSLNDWTLHGNLRGIDVASQFFRARGGTVRCIGDSRSLLHGTTIGGDRGSLATGGTTPPTEVGLLDNAQLWLSECIINPASPASFALSAPGNSRIYTRNMPLDAIRGRIVGNVSTW